MTHRMISKNAASSRAIPTEKFMKAILENPAMPIAFSKNQKGMQASQNLSKEDQEKAEWLWLEARNEILNYVKALSDLGVHKQHVNRLLEPFQHIKVIATATEWSNFFALRCHPDAQPEFQELANQMWNAYSTNKPAQLFVGQWHLPFITKSDTVNVLNDPELDDGDKMVSELIKVSVARCARVSYNTLDGSENSYGKDLQLYDKLVGSTPLHASPTEHQAQALASPEEASGNFKGWLQYRKTLANENVLSFKK